MDSFPIKEGRFVAGKGEHNYQEVIDDFKNAEYIGIVTFNISPTTNGGLIKALKKACKAGVNATVVTNIPKRYPNYYGHQYAVSAKRVISDYIRILDSQSFDMRLSAFFDFNNHAKIIMTNNIAYVGSGNFSDESKKNYENGIISTDAAFIRHLWNDIIPDITIEAIPYYQYNIAEAVAALKSATVFCEKARKVIFDSSFAEWSDYDTNFETVVYYRSYDSDITASMLTEIMEEFDEYEEALKSVGTVVDSFYVRYEDDVPETVEYLEKVYESYRKDYDRMRDLLQTLFDDIEQLAYYSWDDEVSRIVNEDYGMESFDENLDHYMQLAMDEADSDYSSLIDDAEPTIKEILESLDSMQKFYKEMHDSLYGLLKLNLSEIDNTGL